jgi:hypothetical protein
MLTLVACTCSLLSADGEKSKSLPAGVLSALAADETEYCSQFLRKDCHQTFRANLLWRELVITRLGQTAVLVENHNIAFCGSAGCSLYLFSQQQDGNFVQILDAHGETGSLQSIELLKTFTDAHYDLQKTWRDDRTHTVYRWNGTRYSAAPLGSETMPPGIRVELNPEKPLWLRVTLHSGAENTATFFKSQLPWGNRYSMVIVAVTPHGGCLDKELPIDDPGPEEISLAPKALLTGDIDLQWFVRDLNRVTKKSDVQLFWAYESPKELNIPHWSGGWILIPRQK